MALAEQAGYQYLQHVIALLAAVRDSDLHARPSFWQLHQTRRARQRGEPASLLAHEDVLVFQRPLAPPAVQADRPAAPSSRDRSAARPRTPLRENQRGELLCATVAANLMVGGGKPGQGYPAVVIASPSAATQPAANAASPGGGDAMPPRSTIRHGAGVEAVTVSGTLTARVGKGPSSTGDDGALVLQPPTTPAPAPPIPAVIVPARPPESAGLRKGPPPGQSEAARRVAVTVRRLTPTECEWLRGFPDGWTAIDADGRSLSDTARYRFMGNAATVPVVAWIAARLQAAHHTSSTVPLVPPLPPRQPNPSPEDSP